MLNTLTHYLLWNVGLAEATTQTTTEERDCIARHAKNKHRAAEIGVWQGVTTTRIRAALAPDAKLFAIDPFPVGRLGFCAHEHIAKRTVRKQKNASVVWVHKTGAQAGKDFQAQNEAPIDFIFIDGDHSYEGLKADWEAWSGLIAPDGIVCLHDSVTCPKRNVDTAGSCIFTREVILKDPRFRLVETVDTLTVVQRIGSRN